MDGGCARWNAPVVASATLPSRSGDASGRRRRGGRRGGGRRATRTWRGGTRGTCERERRAWRRKVLAPPARRREVATRALTKPSTICEVAPLCGLARSMTTELYHGRSDGATGKESVSRRPAHEQGASRGRARADSNLGFQTSAMFGGGARLRANAEEQVTRLLTQLSDLEEYRDELDDDEYEEMRADTLTQLEEFKASLARMVAGDVTLLNELESIRVRPFPRVRLRPANPSPSSVPRRVPVRRPQSNHPGGASRPRPRSRVCPLTEPLVQFSRALCSSRRERRCPRRFEPRDSQAVRAEAARAASRATGDAHPRQTTGQSRRRAHDAERWRSSPRSKTRR